MIPSPDFDHPPIGMFDSGVGGLTVARALIDVMPDEHLVYVGDTARGPYGSRRLDEVRDIAFEIAGGLVELGVKLIVVACNTATAAALDELRRQFLVPIIGVIDPGLRAALAVAHGRRGRSVPHIGMIGTAGTVESGAYDGALSRLHPGAELISASCPRFVEFVERGVVDGAEIRALADQYLKPLRYVELDALVLGCTHYPLLARVVSDAVGRDVTLISSADETAFEVADICDRTGTRRWRSDTSPPARHVFVCTGDAISFRGLGLRFLGPEVRSVQHAPPATRAGATTRIGR